MASVYRRCIFYAIQLRIPATPVLKQTFHYLGLNLYVSLPSCCSSSKCGSGNFLSFHSPLVTGRESILNHVTPNRSRGLIDSV